VSVAHLKDPRESLDEMREFVRNSPRNTPGVMKLGALKVHYTDVASLYVEYKDIFQQQIYRFESPGRSPRIIDGGACIGMATLYWRQLYPSAEIIAFEPDPALCRVFRENMQANGVAEVRLVEAGLADNAGDRHFSPDGADGGRMADGTGTHSVRTVPLSEFLDKPIEFVKLNIEGQELPVLLEVEAAGRLDNVREMVIEYHGWADSPQCLGSILTLLDRNGFHYTLHDFDREDSPASKPPFRNDRVRDWYCLIHAFRTKQERQDRSCTTRHPVDWGDLRRPEPISRKFGFDRGLPIDRYYIERFLQTHRNDIRGRVLEVGDDSYIKQFGGARVAQSDILHAAPGHSKASIIADLACASHVPDNAYDCIICTQTLHVIFEIQKAMETLHRVLAPGGVLLATIPGISQISRYDMDRWGDYWRLTSLAARRVLESRFASTDLSIESHGNVAAAVGFLQGLATEEMSKQELNLHDPDYELVLTIRAVKQTKDV
jgi:FkbM family methyltransferase